MTEGEDGWLEGKRPLVVEDERLISLCNRDLLEDWGCNVIGPTESATGALALLETDLPDAAILDFDLDGETSEPVAEAISRANLPFLITKGYALRHLGPHARRGQLLDKPVEEQELRMALARWFRT